MNNEYATLVKTLADPARDEAAILAQIEATVMRPEALQQLEQEVEGARRSGAIPEATAARIFTQLREVATKTQLLGGRGASRTGEMPSAGWVLKERFVLKREIGHGGMGTVFAAEDLRKVEAENPETMVAIKVLQPALAAHPTAVMALEREADKAKGMAHPNVATVFDFDRDGDVVFLHMELLNGSPLDSLIRGNKGFGMPRAKAMPIIAGIARGLAYAHEKPLVHADLKPSNIFLTEDGVPKILDFGIARALPGARQKKDRFDAGALGAYTEAYATGEMIQGGDPSTADDVYALGLIAYELLTGKHPYQRLGAPDAQRKGLKPAPIKSLSRREWSVIQRSLSFNRADRPADAGQFLKQLTGISGLQKALIAATVVLVLVAGYFGYARYQATGPEVPFTSLSAADQQAFRESMREGDEAWDFYASKHESFAWHDALAYYAQAWEKHPRNRQASAALRKLASRVLEDSPQDAPAFADEMAKTSPYLRDYPPVRKLAANAEKTP
jgi:serine/threonine protein kinase